MKILAPCVLIASSASSFGFLYTETEFATGTWTVDQRPNETIEQNPAGGNPGAFGQLTTRMAGLPDWTSFYNPTFTYDPSVSGPLTNLHMGFDAKYISGWRPQLYPRIGFGILQNGITWWHSVGALPDQWTHREVMNLSETSFFRPEFGFPNSRPDFSANGAPITFAVTVWAVWDEFEQVTVSGIDNFFVTNEPVPEPATLLAVGAGLGLMRLRRRRAS